MRAYRGVIKEKEALEASLSALSQPGAMEEEKEEEVEVEGEGERSFDGGEGEREGEEREAKSETEESDRDTSIVIEKKVLINCGVLLMECLAWFFL